MKSNKDRKYNGKLEYIFIKSKMAKVEKRYRREKAELLRRMNATGLDWAWGKPSGRLTAG